MYEHKKFILEKNIDRFDFYIEKSDNKASFILALSGALIVALMFQCDSLFTKDYDIRIKIVLIHLLIVALILLVITTTFSLLVILPRTPKMEVKSVMFFEAIKGNKEYYESSISNISESKIIEELTNESLELAKICSKKMNNIKKSLISLIIAIVVIVVIAGIKFLFV